MISIWVLSPTKPIVLRNQFRSGHSFQYDGSKIYAVLASWKRFITTFSEPYGDVYLSTTFTMLFWPLSTNTVRPLFAVLCIPAINSASLGFTIMVVGSTPLPY